MLREKLGRTPKPDLIIAQENSPESFLLCAEAKCFHAAVEAVSRGGRTIKDEIEKDIETLRQLKQLRIAKKVVFMLFDDYYYLREKQKMEEIKSWLVKLPDVKKLYHDTRAKIKDWNELK
jgi:arginine utilization protein RocB